MALLEADVSLPVVRDFVRAVEKEGHGPGGDQIGDAGPAGGQDRA